jgi:hypothetical protein
MLFLEEDDVQVGIAPAFAGVKDERPDRSAIFTITRHDIFLEVWLENNTPQFTDSYVLFHQNEINDEDLALCKRYGAIPIQIFRDDECSWSWITDTVNKFSAFLLNSHRAVAYADIDEIIVDPTGRLQDFDSLDDFVRFVGIEVIQDATEAPLDWNKPVGGQRHFVYSSTNVCKVGLKKRSSYLWDNGQHKLVTEPYELFVGHIRELPNLHRRIYLVHLHYFDKETALKRSQARKNIAAFEKAAGFGRQAWIDTMAEINESFQKKQRESKLLTGRKCSGFVFQDDPWDILNGTVLDCIHS